MFSATKVEVEAAGECENAVKNADCGDMAAVLLGLMREGA